MSLVTQLLFNKWSELVGKYGMEDVSKAAMEIFMNYGTENELEKVRDFYKRYRKTKGDSKIRDKTLDSIRFNIKWSNKHQTAVKEWLRKNVYMPWKGIRLPGHIYPLRYDITLHPNMTTQTFEGRERIYVNITKKTDFIVIHQSNLKMNDIRLMNFDGEDIEIDEEFTYRRNELYVMCLGRKIPPGYYELRTNFSGKFSTDGNGMNRYQYVHRKSGETRYSLATRFEATFARKLFPCFDEPAMKAKFNLSIVHEVAHTAVSNMPVKTKLTLTNGLIKTVFMESVDMSTYLVTCIVSDFDYLEATYKGKQIRAYAPPDRIQEAEHGLNLTLRILEDLENYFEVPYVLPKLDSVVIPNYTVPAMEHWGAITYSTERFLVNDSLTTYKRIVDIDRVIAHELVHQWFGNLVTMDWWNDLWLSEGVSTLIMYIPLRHYSPSINDVDVRKRSRMMCTDSTMDSSPIVRNVTTPDEINESFDVIAYEKGAAVMNMLQHQMGDNFRKGLSSYLKKHSYNTAKTQDLWNELSNVSKTPYNISEMMDTWTLQFGFPYVEVERTEGQLIVTQHLFSRHVNKTYAELVAREPPFAKYGFIWKIPLVYKNLVNGEEHTLWLNSKRATFRINDSSTDVLKFNPGFVGFYIVRYEPPEWSQLGQFLLEDHKRLSVTDRYNLLHDAFFLASTGRLVYDIPLELTKYLRRETDALPWVLFRDYYLHFVRRLDPGSPVMPLLKRYTAELTSDLYNQYVGDKPNKSLFRKYSVSTGPCAYTYTELEFIPSIIDLACQASNPKCLKVIHEELQLYLLGQNITSEAQWVVEMGVSNFGNLSLWEFFYDELIANDTGRLLAAEALASFTTPALIEKTLEVVMFDSLVNAEMSQYILQRLSNKPHAIPHLWNYTRNHWENLTRSDAKNNLSVGISAFCKLKTMTYFNQFIMLMKRKPQMSDFLMAGCIQDIQKSVEWTDKYEESLLAWFAWNTQETTATV